MRRIVAIMCCALFGGCTQPHLTLSAPPAAASLSERSDAYAALRPASTRVTTEASTWLGATIVTSRRTDYMELGDGRRVYHPEDLLSVIPRDSDTALSISEVRRSERRETWLGAAAGICALAGGALVAVSLAKQDPPVPLWAGLTIGIGGTLVFGLAA